MDDKTVDYSYSRPQPFPESIPANGFDGALRYLGFDYGSGVRCITKTEYQRLSAQGSGVGLVWETVNNMALGSYETGRQHGVTAAQQARDQGHPRFVFVAVDFQVMPSQYGIVDSFIDGFTAGFRSIIPNAEECEPYAHYDYIEHWCLRKGRQRGGWQCAAWSGTGSGTGGSIQGRRCSNKARLFQKVGYVLNDTCDENAVLDADWGQHNYNGPKTPGDDSLSADEVTDLKTYMDQKFDQQTQFHTDDRTVIINGVEYELGQDITEAGWASRPYFFGYGMVVKDETGKNLIVADPAKPQRYEWLRSADAPHGKYRVWIEDPNELAEFVTTGLNPHPVLFHPDREAVHDQKFPYLVPPPGKNNDNDNVQPRP
jgi:hypothetical protein